MGLKRRLALAFILLAVLPLTAAGIVLTRASYDTAYDLRLADQRQTAASAATEVHGHIERLMRELLLTVRVKGPSRLRPDERQALLQELLVWESQFADLAWLDENGTERLRVSLTADQPGATDGRNLSDVLQPLHSGGLPVFGPIEIDPTTSEPLMAVAVPEINPRTDTVAGILVARLRLKRMWDAVAEAPQRGDGSVLVYIADPSGLVVAHPDPNLVLKGVRAHLPASDGLATGLSGDAVLTAQVPLVAGNRRFLVVAEQPLRQALTLPLHTALTTLMVVAGGLAAALALAILANRSIILPIQRLAEVAGRISAGDLSRRAADSARADEIGELARAFNAMTARLVESVASLEARVDARTRDLATAKARLVEAIESISEGFILCDPDDNVVLANRRFRDFYPEIAHLAREGRPFADLLQASARLGLAQDTGSAESWFKQRQHLRANQVPHIQHLSSGRWLLVNERRTASGQMVAIYTDITILKAGEEELRQAKAMAESAAQAKSEFLAAMSHELRTPLNAIIGFSDIMLSGVFGDMGNDRYREYASDIHSSGLHLLSLINDILDLSKIEAGAMVLERLPVPVTAVVDRALAMIRDAANANALRLEVKLPAELPPVAGDDRRLLQVLLNLMSNAVKFTPEGGRVSIEGHEEGGQVVVQVADTGIGIAPSDIPRAMEAFGQVDSSRSRRFPGSGLGLPLSRKLVELLGGTLSIDSMVGVGTTVTLRLPKAMQ